MTLVQNRRLLYQDNMIDVLGKTIAEAIRNDELELIPGLNKAIEKISEFGKKEKTRKEQFLKDHEESHPYASVIYKYRMDHAMTQDDFAVATGFGREVVGQWERAIRHPRKSSIDYVRKALPDFEEYERANPYIKELNILYTDVIRDFRKFKKLNRKDFAEKTGLTYVTLCNWEDGRALPTFEAMDAIRKAFPEFKEWEERYEGK